MAPSRSPHLLPIWQYFLSRLSGRWKPLSTYGDWRCTQHSVITCWTSEKRWEEERDGENFLRLSQRNHALYQPHCLTSPSGYGLGEMATCLLSRVESIFHLFFSSNKLLGLQIVRSCLIPMMGTYPVWIAEASCWSPPHQGPLLSPHLFFVWVQAWGNVRSCRGDSPASNAPASNAQASKRAKQHHSADPCS